MFICEGHANLQQFRVAKKGLAAMWKINALFQHLPNAVSVENTGVRGKKQRIKKLCKSL